MEQRDTPPDVVFYTGCNVLRTPHIALLALEVLDKLGTSYEVMGGVGQCCGVYQFREGDFANNSKMANATIEGLASAGTSTVLSWCPSCQLSIGEVSLPNYEAQFGEKPFDLNPFLVFLADHAEELQRMMVNRVEKRIALHERPVFPQTMDAVRTLAGVIPGLELVELDVPRIGVQANTISPPKFKQELLEREFRLAAEAGVDILATIYHADHREICDAATGKSFEIVNFMELLGEALGIDSDDAYKRLKQIKDIDDMIVETAPLIEANKLDLDTVRDALAWEFGK
jgi:Fe-S oxidoreductase